MTYAGCWGRSPFLGRTESAICGYTGRTVCVGGGGAIKTEEVRLWGTGVAVCVCGGRGALKGQAWTRHFAPATPAFARPSSPSQFTTCASHCSVLLCLRVPRGSRLTSLG